MSHAAIAISQHPAAARGATDDAQERSRIEKTKDKLRTLLQRPSSGRTTSLGRKVEKPGTAAPAGPSGQTESAQHDRKHTNK